MKMDIKKRLVQGDVVLVPIDKLPDGAVEQKFEKKVLQESEVTGHHHHFRPTAKVGLFQDANFASSEKTITPNMGKFVLVYEDSELYHGKEFDANPHALGRGDHKSIKVPAGLYRIDIVREFDYDRHEVSRVRD